MTTSPADVSLAPAIAAIHRGDPLSALALTQARREALALAVRAVALAQLDETRSARRHLRRAERAFSAAGETRHALRARLAEAEIALLDLDLTHAHEQLASVEEALRRAGDGPNAAWALLLQARAACLQGDAEGARRLLARCREGARGGLPPLLEAVLALAEAEGFARELRAAEAETAAAEARRLSARAGHPALEAEAARVSESLRAPIARLPDGRLLALADVAALGAGPGIVVDACRARVVGPAGVVDLARRPVLFELLSALAEAAPEGVPADVLARTLFGARTPNASHHARLRVELGRLRRITAGTLGPIVQERRIVRWQPALPPVVLLPLVSRREARVRAALADGRAWPVTALADVVGQSPRTVQRMLADLSARGDVTALGRGRACRYALPGNAPRIASWMLLAALGPVG